jgi:hypothetical protein
MNSNRRLLGLINEADARNDSPERRKARKKLLRLYRCQLRAYRQALHEARNPVMVNPMLANFFIGVGLQIFADERPEKALREFLHGLPKKGAKGRDFDEQIEIAAAVERLSPGMTLTKAYKTVAAAKSKNIEADAIRKIHANVMKSPVNAARVRLIVANAKF